MSFSVMMVAGLVILAEGSFVPYLWQIHQLKAIVPVSSLVTCHMLLPLALNPALMTFSWKTCETFVSVPLMPEMREKARVIRLIVLGP